MSDESNSTVSPVTWFEIGAEDPGAARAFYGDLFGWTFNVTGEYSEISYGPGQPPQGGIQDTSGPGPDGAARGYAIPYVQVTDVAATCAAVEQRGGKILIRRRPCRTACRSPTSPIPSATTSGCSSRPPDPGRPRRPDGPGAPPNGFA
jgi:predicted enzyme related to lactoylglutathione lyase